MAIKLSRSNRFIEQLETLRPLDKQRIDQLVKHYIKKRPKPRGVDKETGKGNPNNVYVGKNIRHFHISEPDPVLMYQLTNTQLNLVVIATHAEMFGSEENQKDFFATIENDLFDSQNPMRRAMNLVESFIKMFR